MFPELKPQIRVLADHNICGTQARARPRRVWLGRIVFLAVLVGVFGYVLSGPAARLDTADKLASIGALILAAVTFVLTQRPVPVAVVGDVPDERAAAGLARLVQRQWGVAGTQRPTPRGARRRPCRSAAAARLPASSSAGSMETDSRES